MPLFPKPQPYEEFVRGAPGRLLDVGGQRVHIEEVGDGPPLLLLHGFVSSTFSFREILPRLAEGHRVIALDLTGFGFSERPAHHEAYTPASQLAAIEAVLDQLDARGCPVLGHSYGGTLALLHAATSKSAPIPLVLISPVTEFDKPPFLLRSATGRALAFAASCLLLSRRRLFRKVFSRAYYQKEIITESVAETVRARLFVEGIKRVFDGYVHGFRSAPEASIALEEITAPALVIAGQHDEIVPLEDCRRTAARLPKGELPVLGRSGHSAPEEQPEETCAAIKAFLTAHRR